ncbi:MAG: hypothetical protein VKI63_09400 [Cyanobium sp.]|nr:hypothetical protein [Cyanobium sp.]
MDTWPQVPAPAAPPPTKKTGKSTENPGKESSHRFTFTRFTFTDLHSQIHNLFNVFLTPKFTQEFTQKIAKKDSRNGFSRDQSIHGGQPLSKTAQPNNNPIKAVQQGSSGEQTNREAQQRKPATTQHRVHQTRSHHNFATDHFSTEHSLATIHSQRFIRNDFSEKLSRNG